MTLAGFKDLCLDVSSGALGQFWGSVLSRTVTSTGGDDFRIEAVTAPEETIWVNQVPEARHGKTRVHLDLRLATSGPEPVLALGAVLVREPTADMRWWVLADPEGNEFCCMSPRADAPVDRITPFEVNVDCADPLAQATWWAGVWGGTVGRHDTEPWAWVTGAAGSPYEDWVFAAVPEPKTVKNRWHWDVTLTGHDVQPLLDHGATLVREQHHDGAFAWWVLQDPEGNEFCAFKPRG